MTSTTTTNTISNIYYPLPKMNPRNIFNLVPLYTTATATQHHKSLSILHNSVQFFLKDFQERFIKKYPPTTTNNPTTKKKPQEIDKEWSKLNSILIQLHLFHSPLNFLNHLNLNNDSSWNFIHYFPLIFNNTNQNYINNNTPQIPNKYYYPSIGLFLLPHTFYLSNLQSADLILSLYDTFEEQTVYLTLFALLVQNHKGSFVMKLNYFYTPLMMDILYLLSCVYNKVIILPIDFTHFYVICKGFQIDYLKPHYEQIKYMLLILRPNSLQRISPNPNPNNSESISRIFSHPLPSLFTSKIEEINVLIHHKQLIHMND
jgi:hypothetical protein